MRFLYCRDIYRDGNLLDSLSHLYQLGSAGLGMGLQLASFCPPVRLVVVVDVAEHEAALGPVDNDPDVAANPDGPEVAVSRAIKPVELQAWTGRVHL